MGGQSQRHGARGPRGLGLGSVLGTLGWIRAHGLSSWSPKGSAGPSEPHSPGPVSVSALGTPTLGTLCPKAAPASCGLSFAPCAG